MNDAAAEQACLAVGRVVEHAGLPRRYAVLAGNEIDLDALRATAEPSRPRRTGRAHAHEHLVPPDTERLLDGALADPVHVAQAHAAGAQCFARPDDDAPRRRIEPHHIERIAGRDAEPAALSDREANDAVVAAEHLAIEIDDVARLGRARPQALDHFGVAAGRHEADILAVVLVRDRKTELASELASLGLAALTERKAQHVELLARGREQEIALVALRIARAIERASAAGERARGDVVPGGDRKSTRLNSSHLGI